MPPAPPLIGSGAIADQQRNSRCAGFRTLTPKALPANDGCVTINPLPDFGSGMVAREQGVKLAESQASIGRVTSAYEQAAQTLYQGPHEAFVAKRQELAGELKRAGDKTNAARLAKLPRPSLTAWAVNQLWWHARSAFDELFETAQQVRTGKAPASGAHRQAVSKLTARAKQLLESDEHGSNEATLRRITMTLSALAAAGSWDPEQPGMLAKDLDPPGFEAFGITTDAPSEQPRAAAPTPSIARSKAHPRAHAEAQARAEADAKRARELEREAAAAEKKRLTELRIQHQAQKTELESALRAAKLALKAQEHEHARAEKALKAAEHEVERARAKVEAAEAALLAHATND